MIEWVSQDNTRQARQGDLPSKLPCIALTPVRTKKNTEKVKVVLFFFFFFSSISGRLGVGKLPAIFLGHIAAHSSQYSYRKGCE